MTPEHILGYHIEMDAFEVISQFGKKKDKIYIKRIEEKKKR